MADVFLNLIDPLEERFSWKDKSDREIEVARRDMVDAFKNYTVDELKGGQRYIVLHRKFSTMPNVADIREVIERMIAERKAAEAKPAANKGVTRTSDEFTERLKHEREEAKAWAREWLQKTPLGQESLREGWCRDLHNLIWQIRHSRVKAGRPCGFDDIKLNDIATQSMRGADVIERFRANRAPNVDLEQRLVLGMKFA